MYGLLVTLIGSHKEKVIFHIILFIFWFDEEHYTDTAGQSCPNYIRAKRDNPKACLTNPMFAIFP